jgi:myo-inositol 2-dehydrogenase / D-chiro-inositol 1-dehydrogenase
MRSHSINRRSFLSTSIAALSAGVYAAPLLRAADPRQKNDRLRIGAIGLRYQGSVIAEKILPYGDIVALCDVDREILEKTREKFGGQAELFENYQDLLARDDIDVVTIGTPDHWHTKMLIDACRAGKDVYCEKPLTLTIDEGKHIRRVVQETKRVVQVGSWQRSDDRFRLACEMVRAGRIGALRKVTVVLGKNVTGGPFATEAVPQHFHWNLWQGQTPDVPYIPQRSHYTFRWWQEYSGGQMTDWGAHHVDIALWGIGRDRSGPTEISGTAKYPDIADGYNVPVDFEVRYRFSDGLVVEVADHGRNGVMFEGEAGRIFVNRENLAGKPVDQLDSTPLRREDYKLYGFDNLDRPPRVGKLESIVNHMGNFYDCLQTRKTPISDVESQHRSVTACHLANIALRLGRTVHWDPEREQFVNDPEADRFLTRPQRSGFEIG